MIWLIDTYFKMPPFFEHRLLSAILFLCYICLILLSIKTAMKRTFGLFVCVCMVVLAWGTIPPGYYDTVQGKRKEALKTALHEVIREADVLNYGSGEGATWWGFYETDRLDNNRVCDHYSNEVFYFTHQGTVPAGMNIEHSFAKSWWGGSKNQAYKDIHHLMPSEITINSSKGNYGMGVVTQVNVDNGCTKVGKGPGAGGTLINLWEPADRWKGDFARVYMYMATCYQNLSWTGEALKSLQNNDWPTLQPWAYELYLQWSRQDPVDEFEVARNEAVYRIQGNRNPFVDFPNLCRYVWGDSTAYAFDLNRTMTSSDFIGTKPGPDPVPEYILNIAFADGNKDFALLTAEGTTTDVWYHDNRYQCMTANAFSKGKEADAWLISPQMDLTGYKTIVLTFDHATGFNLNASAEHLFTVCVSTDYAGVPNEATWDELVPAFPEWPTKNFTPFVTSGTVDLSAYAGKYITLAFRYRAHADECYAWEVKNLLVKGEKQTVDIDENFASPLLGEQAVFSLGGIYMGTEVPCRKGVYIVRRNGMVYKVTVKE